MGSQRRNHPIENQVAWMRLGVGLVAFLVAAKLSAVAMALWLGLAQPGLSVWTLLSWGVTGFIWWNTSRLWKRAFAGGIHRVETVRGRLLETLVMLPLGALSGALLALFWSAVGMT